MRLWTWLRGLFTRKTTREEKSVIFFHFGQPMRARKETAYAIMFLQELPGEWSWVGNFGLRWVSQDKAASNFFFPVERVT